MRVRKVTDFMLLFEKRFALSAFFQTLLVVYLVPCCCLAASSLWSCLHQGPGWIVRMARQSDYDNRGDNDRSRLPQHYTHQTRRQNFTLGAGGKRRKKVVWFSWGFRMCIKYQSFASPFIALWSERLKRTFKDAGIFCTEDSGQNKEPLACSCSPSPAWLRRTRLSRWGNR